MNLLVNTSRVDENNMASKMFARKHVAQRAKPAPVRGTAINQVGMMRRFGSNSDLSRCSDSSSEDVFLSANEDSDTNEPQPNRRSPSPGSLSRTRSSSAGPRGASKQLMKTSPASLGGSSGAISSSLKKKSPKTNSLSKSVTFGSRELKPDKKEDTVTPRKVIAPAKLLPDKPKMFQRSVSTSAACLTEGTDGEHRPVICGKDRKKPDSSMKLSKSFDNISFEEEEEAAPEPKGDPDLFAKMELLFEEYRKIELGIFEKIEAQIAKEFQENSQEQSQKSDSMEKTAQRGRKYSRDDSQVPSTNAQRQPISSQRGNNTKVNSNLANGPKQKRPSSAPSKRTTAPQETEKKLTRTTPSRGRASPSPSRPGHPGSPQVSSVSGQNVHHNNWTSSKSLQVDEWSDSRRSSETQTMNSKGTSPAGSSLSLSNSNSSLHSQEVSSPRTRQRTLSGRSSGRSSPAPKMNTSLKTFDFPETNRSSTNASHNRDTSSNKAKQKGYTSEAFLKVKAHSRSNLRRSTECLDLSKPEMADAEIQTSSPTEIVESSVDPPLSPGPRTGRSTGRSPGRSPGRSSDRMSGRTSGRSSPMPKTRTPSPAPVKSRTLSLSNAETMTDRKRDQGTVQSQVQRPRSRNNSGSVTSSRPRTPSIVEPERGRPITPDTPTLVINDEPMTLSLDNLNEPESPTIKNTTSKRVDSTDSTPNQRAVSQRRPSSGIPTSPRGRTPDKATERASAKTPGAQRRSASLQRVPSAATPGKKAPASGVQQAAPLSVRSRTTLAINKASEGRGRKSSVGESKAPSKKLSGSQPELKSSGLQPKPKQTSTASRQAKNPAQTPKTTVNQNYNQGYASLNNNPQDTAANKDLQNADDTLVFSSDATNNNRGSRKSRIPQPIGRVMDTKTFNGRQLKRCDSGVEINSMSPTESNANPDENWQENNVFDFQPLSAFDDSDDEYY